MRRLLLLPLAVLLAGCAGDGLSNQERDDQRYRDCIAAGGDYTQPIADGVGFRCDLP